MFKRKNILSFVLVSNLLAVPIFETQEVLARVETQTQENVVEPTFNVFLQVDENAPQSQKKISYDIIDITSQEVVYSHRSEDKEKQPIELTAGEYIFRLYDGGKFQRDDQSIKPYQVQIGQENQEKAEEIADDSGEIVELADQTIVYDYAFTIDESHLEKAPVFAIYLVGDQVQNPQVPEIESLAEDSSQEAESSQESSQTEVANEVGDINVILQDSAGNLIPNVGIVIDDQEVLTNEQGIAQFQGIAAGNYVMTFGQLPEAMTGYEIEENVEIYPGQATEFNLTLSGIIEDSTTSQTTVEAKADLQEVGDVNVILKDSMGNVVPNVGIVIGDQEVLTNEQGIAQFQGIAAGNYVMTFGQLPEAMTGYEIEENVEIYPGQAYDFPLTLSGVIEDSTTSQTTVEAKADLQIEVYDQEEAPVEGVKIELTNMDDPEFKQELVSDQSGIAQASEIPVGNYQYKVIETPETHSAQGTLLEAPVLANEENRQVIGITKLDQVGQLNILVTDTQGQAIPQAQVQLLGKVYTTDDNGSILIDSLAVGNYDVTLVTVPGNADLENNVQSVEVSFNQSTDLTFEVEETTTTMETTTTVEPTTEEPTTTTQEPEAVLTIQVQDQNSDAVEGASIRLMNKENGQEQEIITDSQGLASASDLALGNYQYQVSQTPEGYAAEGNLIDVAVENEEPALQAVTIQKEDEVGQISVAISNEQGQGVANVQMQIGELTVETDETGMAVIEEMPVGNYEVKMLSVPESYRTDQFSPETIEVVANQKVELAYQLEEIPTTEEPTTTTVAPTTQESTTTTVAEESKVPEMVFKDLENGGEVLLTKAEAKKVNKVLIQPVNLDPANLPSELKGKDFIAYEIKAFDQNGSEIRLENPTLIKLPTRPINSQLLAMKVMGQQVQGLKVRVNQQTANVESQGLGTVALVYGDAKADQTTTNQTQEDGKAVVVKKSTDRKEAEKGNLPTTGEMTSKVIYLVAGTLVVGGALLIALKRRNQVEDK
ncbi:SpaA isopeptide-forming pilin-related protein [Facklamia sp. 7083-14-GEN3]|uniref:SpaA isopeptide-forming pilin-related protein n=1 Tax=Facklamia sp. 7083-14-GEN3 TaxID=2973478 RepID=UPI00215CB671|nr:SpaA isopeptide-forming pilin-related protein [Facklamia sp. 7083-14-GEN3]MCR8968392.1 SpaA isopeptide-forming pilin-related protein [Facklamia sp. 7083-14-GEN3]